MAKSLSQTGGFVGLEPIHETIIYGDEEFDVYFKDRTAPERDADSKYLEQFPENSREQTCQLLSRVLHEDGPDSPIISYDRASQMRDTLLTAILGAWMRVLNGPKA